MLDRVIRFALDRRLLVAALSIVVAVYGAVVSLDLPIDVLPDLNRPTVTVMTEAHGLTPEDVEQLVTRPIEQSVNGATGVERVRSVSGMGLSIVFVEFGWETEIYRNRQLVQELLVAASPRLPPGVEPHMTPISSIMGQIQLVGVRSRGGTMDPTEIRAIVDRDVKLRLASLKGVAQIVTIGGARRELQVIVDADKLKAHDVGLRDVADAIAAANMSGSGGVMPTGAKGPLVTVTGLARRTQDIEGAAVGGDAARPVRIADVARVEFGPAAMRTGDAGVDGGPGVILVVFKQPGIDTVDLSNRVEEELRQLAPSLPGDLEILPAIYRQADFIHRAIENVGHAVRDGSLLVVVVLFLFLLNFRTTVITLTAIPMSIAMTAIFFRLFGISINTMTLGGLAVAVGSLVDDAIVDVENVFRRLRQAPGAPPLRVVYEASREVRKPIVVGTLVVAAVYLPLFALSGMEGKLFAPIGIAYIVSILASLVVSLTLTPVLCFWLLPKARRTAHGQDGWAVRRLKGLADRCIRLSLDHPVRMSALLGAFVLAGIAILLHRGSEFLPPFNEGSAQINLVLPPGTSLETADAHGRRLDRVISGVAGVSGVGRRTGRAEGDEHAEGVNFTEAIVSFDADSGRTREETLTEIRRLLAEEFPGVAVSAEQPLAHLLSHLLSGVNAQVAIKIFGPDLGVLRRLAQQVQGAVAPIEGVADLIVEAQVLVEKADIRPRREALARVGLTVRDVAETVELAMEGEEMSRLILGQVAYPIILRLEEKDRRDLVGLRGLLLRTPSGGLLPLGEVADVRMAYTPNNINRENVSRRIVVQHNVQGRSLGEVVGDVERAMGPLRAKLPAGYSVRISGQFEAQAEASRIIVWLSMLSLVAMFLLIYGHFQSVNLALQALASIPMAFVGAVCFIVATGQTLSIATLVGLISLGGIAARNTILLIDHYLHLLREEGEAFSREMIFRAGRERIVPVVMTALCSGIALLPLVLSPGEPGRELLYPVASVIVGGLISSTLLDVLLTPGLFWLFGRGAVERLQSEKKENE